VCIVHPQVLATLTELAASPPSASKRDPDSELELLRAALHRQMLQAGVIPTALRLASEAEVRPTK